MASQRLAQGGPLEHPGQPFAEAGHDLAIQLIQGPRRAVHVGVEEPDRPTVDGQRCDDVRVPGQRVGERSRGARARAGPR